MKYYDTACWCCEFAPHHGTHVSVWDNAQHTVRSEKHNASLSSTIFLDSLAQVYTSFETTTPTTLLWTGCPLSSQRRALLCHLEAILPRRAERSRLKTRVNTSWHGNMWSAMLQDNAARSMRRPSRAIADLGNDCSRTGFTV